jgi:hypothetical protein
MTIAVDVKWGRRCVFIKRNGERCRKYAVRGGTCCASHNNTKAVRAAAARRMEDIRNAALLSLTEMVPQALATLATAIQQQDATGVKAALAVLDRAGLAVVDKREVSVHVSDDDVKLDRLIVSLVEQRARELREGEVVDAEVVAETP